MNLKQYARKHTTGGITWWAMPYQTLRNQSISNQFNAICPSDARGNVELLFVAMESFVIDVEFAKKLNADEQRFADYWRERPLDFRERWETFTFVVSTEVINAFWDAFVATRDRTVENIEPMEADERPNASPASETT